MHLRSSWPGWIGALSLSFATGAAALVTTAHANPSAPSAFCAVYPTAPACADGPAACTTCHVQPPPRNQFGEQLSKALLPGTPRPLSDAAFLAGLPDALAAVAPVAAPPPDASARAAAVAVSEGTYLIHAEWPLQWTPPSTLSQVVVGADRARQLAQGDGVRVFSAEDLAGERVLLR